MKTSLLLYLIKKITLSMNKNLFCIKGKEKGIFYVENWNLDVKPF